MTDSLPGSKLDGQTVLVTGGAGFIGSHIAETICERCGNSEVRVLDGLSGGSRSNVPDGATFFEGDVRDEDVLERATAGVDVVFHEAALVSVAESVERPLASHDLNTTATLHGT